MGDNYDYKPRLTFEVSQELKDRADRVLSTYGIRKTIFKPIIEDLLDLIETHGQIVIGILLEEAVKPREVFPSLAKAERSAKNVNTR